MSITQFYIFILVFLLIILGSMVYFQKTDPNADFRKVIPIGGVALSLLLLPIFSMGVNWLTMGAYSPITTIRDSQVLEKVLYDRTKDSDADLKIEFSAGDLLSVDSTIFTGRSFGSRNYVKVKGTDIDLEAYEGIIKAEDSESLKEEDLYQIIKVSLGTIEIKNNEKDPNTKGIIAHIFDLYSEDKNIPQEEYISKEPYIEVVVKKVQANS